MKTGAARLGPDQVKVFCSGNEAAAMAASQINFHLMGYYPITPSTEIAEQLDQKAEAGEHRIRLVAADGEHGAAGICFGAACGGGRVFNATSANGYLYALEQLPVQAGSRRPMVMDLVTRTVSGPLDIRCDHSDLYFALNTGWVILLARDPQAAYDMNIAAVRVGEHPDVRLPVLVAYDGFFTSHQKRPIHVLASADDVQSFVGPVPDYPHALDPARPVTIGPYMNDPDLIHNKYQLHLAMEAARRVIPAVLAEYGALTGRHYPVVDCYRLDGAEAAIFLLNSAAETAKDVVDELRAEGYRVGAISPNVLRPFPAAEVAAALRGVGAVMVGDRADSYGSGGGNMAHEVKAALQDDPDSTTRVLTRVYGLGGLEFEAADARALLLEAVAAARSGRVDRPFAYHGVTPGDPEAAAGAPALPPLRDDEVRTGLVEVTPGPDGPDVRTAPFWALMKKARRLAPGHGACPGCGIFTALNQFLMGIEGHVAVLYQTGCAMVTTTGYPYTSHRVTYIHNLFQNGAATLSGLVEMFHERKRRGELPPDTDLTFLMISGDGGMDIGMGPAIGTALRGHGLIMLEYDNQGYMNTGAQASYATPLGHATATTHGGKRYHHKDTVEIMAACHMPYVFTASEGFPLDTVRKAAKAQWYAREVGPVYGKMLISCPLNWRAEDSQSAEILQAATNSCFFPLYEVAQGKTRITYDPDALGKRVPVARWLEQMGKTRHLIRPGHAAELAEHEAEVERRWQRLKARHDHPLL